jgi:hypothetical protein
MDVSCDISRGVGEGGSAAVDRIWGCNPIPVVAWVVMV